MYHHSQLLQVFVEQANPNVVLLREQDTFFGALGDHSVSDIEAMTICLDLDFRSDQPKGQGL
jgi:hypothetical protein